MEHKGKDKERDKVLLKCCFRLMAHLPEVRGTLFSSQSKEAGSLITMATDETMGIDMTLSFRAFAHTGRQCAFHYTGQVPSAPQNHFNSFNSKHTQTMGDTVCRHMCVWSKISFSLMRSKIE